jgi:hypothetical protein
MKLKLFLIVLFYSCTQLYAQSLKSPDDFLGYQLGDKYTPHYKIANYFKYVSDLLSSQMKLEQYGQTNEGRPLLLAIIASAENLSRIEAIRKNNLRLTGLLNDQLGDANAPAIVWLSYNVHGNETSSSEVAMKVLYELLNPANSMSKEYLKNTVVLIDPCLNPDGRDRYVNWFTSVMGRNANVNPDAREHNEPWPGGRTNHYNFDLNRDWAWQTQVETQQRIKKYNEWMPHVHSDYHEQGYNDPYYFAPAAEPYHEVITPWQRNFQVEMGKSHAKYFDANGWLYFTKEIFDLFYPSYGDTYPLYNGAIGMTFEQAGLGRAGTAVVTKNADTLTLKDRIEHHFITSMSTLEVVAKNTERVVKEFKKFFDDAKLNGVGEYKSFIITDTNQQKIKVLKKLLDINAIAYGSVSGTTLKGFNYFTRKEESFTTNKSLVVSTYQPKATLAKVLFEPSSKLVDSATYDLTAWSLPYVYGVQGYAVKEKVTATAFLPTPKSVLPETAYGYAIKYNSFEDAKILAALINANCKLRYAEREFTIDNKKFDKGTLIILKKGNETKLKLIADIVSKFDAGITAISSGLMGKGYDIGSSKMHFINPPKVAMLTGSEVSPESAGEVWHLFDQQLSYPITLINGEDVNNINWKNIDVLILPNGKYKLLSDKEICGNLKNWVRQGGKIIALENSVAQMVNDDWGIKIKKEEVEKKEDNKPSYADIKIFEKSEHDGIMGNIAGAIYKVDLDNSHPLAFGYPNYYFMLKQDANIYEFTKEGWSVGIIKENALVAGFVGSKIKSKVKDAAVIIAQDYGKGSIVYFPDNPIFRSFWENGKLLFSNAVFLVGQ